ncbi:hypothetical protein [Antribacter gilvus]|uniref:hypothetical protein n=1 Tax=Antribacter gilvus TaxID=2304675 RepID=UPI000F796515|nr:hypothetical protein [Antribacter gilvus]
MATRPRYTSDPATPVDALRALGFRDARTRAWILETIKAGELIEHGHIPRALIDRGWRSHVEPSRIVEWITPTHHWLPSSAQYVAFGHYEDATFEGRTDTGAVPGDRISAKVSRGRVTFAEGPYGWDHDFGWSSTRTVVFGWVPIPYASRALRIERPVCPECRLVPCWCA